MDSNIYLPITDAGLWFCETGCAREASWICHPQGYLTRKIHLCQGCKAKAEQQERARMIAQAQETRDVELARRVVGWQVVDGREVAG